MSSEIENLPNLTDEIKNYIYTIRGKQVMLDSDVAKLFNYETKDLNRNVKNNINRFPEYYCFRLTDDEFKSLRCKNFTLNKNGRGEHRKYLPYVFTEYGITMLAGLLKSEIAVNISIKIVNAFIEMRRLLNSNGQVFERLTNVEYTHAEISDSIMVINRMVLAFFMMSLQKTGMNHALIHHLDLKIAIIPACIHHL